MLSIFYAQFFEPKLFQYPQFICPEDQKQRSPIICELQQTVMKSLFHILTKLLDLPK